MKAIANHLGQIIAVLAAIAVLIAAVVVFRAPIGGFFNSITEKQTAVGGDLLDNIDVSELGNLSSGGGNGGGGGSGSGGSEELVVEGTVPVGSIYLAANGTTLTEGETFSVYGVGDIFVSGDYIYASPDGSDCWGVQVLSTDIAAWFANQYGISVEGVDKAQQVEFDPIAKSINGKPVKYMMETFSNCTAMTTAPQIPSSVVSMESVFANCEALESAPIIPAGVTSMRYTFQGCTAMTTAPQIPDSVVDMTQTFSGCTSLETVGEISGAGKMMAGTFEGCTSLKGTITINAEVTEWRDCFRIVDFQTQQLNLAGSSAQLDNLACENSRYCGDCGRSHSTYCEDCNGYCTCGAGIH